jgi:autotransporter-associated beta strand protein
MNASRKFHSSILAWLMASLSFAFIQTAQAQPYLVEQLGRGVVAVRSSSTEVFVSWRVLGTDPVDVSFNLYRATGSDPAVLLNTEPITGATNFVDTPPSFTEANAYFVRPILFGVELAPSAAFTLPADSPEQQYLRLPMQRPAPGVTPVGENYDYSPNDMSVGDLDGDGEYEFVVKWEPSNQKDSSQDGYTGNTYIDAYRLDGTQLWRIDLGVNVRAGPHDTQFFVHDLDGDGRAEISVRTAAGSRDGLGNFVADPANFSGLFPTEPFDHNADYRNASGRALVGPEFMTILNGLTGAELSSTKFLPARHPDTDFPTTEQMRQIWGDTSGNRQGRYYPPGAAYLDGQRPSIVWGRGYAGGQEGHPGHIGVAAWNYRDGEITFLWEFGTAGGQGGHTSVVADLDGDGRDDIVYGQVWVDADGQLIQTGWGHGDAIHVSDMDPDRPGLEVFMPHESPGDYGSNALSFQSGPTGETIWGVSATGDIGRGVAADIDPRFRGYEAWGSGSTGGLYNAQLWVPNPVLGPRALPVSASKPSQINHVVWWTGDLLRELLDGNTISKWNWNTDSVDTVFSPDGVSSINGSKSNPCLQADIFGDWREEVVFRENTNEAVRIYTTTIPTEHRIYTLMHDRQYRSGVASQNVGYNQPPHPSFFLGHEMTPPPVPNIVTTLGELIGPPPPVFTAIAEDTGPFANDQVTSDATLVLHGTAQANSTVTISIFGGTTIGTTVADGTGAWSFDYTNNMLSEGDHLFVATATDTEGNTGLANFPPLLVTIDATAPNTAVIESVVASGSDLIVGGAGEPLARIEVQLAGTGTVGTADADADGVWAATIDGGLVPSGEAEFTAVQMDLAGNAGPESAAFTVNTALAVPIITGVDEDSGVSASDGITNDNTLVVNGTGAVGSTVAVSLSGAGVIGTTEVGAGGEWSFDYTATVLADGTHGFSAVTSGGAGSDSPSSEVFVVVVDTAAPQMSSIERLEPSAMNTAATTVTFRATFSEEVSGITTGTFLFTPTSGLVTGNVASVSASSGLVVDVVVDSLAEEGMFRLDVPPGTGVTDAAGNGLGAFADGESYNRLITGSGTWIDPLGGLWSDQANWEGAIIGAGINNAADFGMLDIVGDVTATLDSPRAIGTLIFADANLTSLGSWIVEDGGNAANALTLAVSAASPVISVAPVASGPGATLNVGLIGTQGLNKQGTGTLVLTRANNLSGALNVAGGTLRLEQDASFAASTVNVAGGGTRLNIAGGTFSATGTTTVTAGGGSALIFDDGTGTFATLATTNAAGGLIRINGGVVSATSVNLPRSNDNNLNFGAGFVVAGGDVTVNGIVGLGTANSNGVMSVEGTGNLVVNGPVRVGDLAGSTRGGIMRVINSATLVVTDTTEGIILTRRQGNTSVANFDGGMATTELLSIGAAGVTAGSATVNVRGGSLYLGGSGLVRTGTPTTNINLQSGILGAKANWSTTVPLTLSTGGNIAIQAEDASGTPFDITLAGAIGGNGGFTKTGTGRLTLGAANTFGGAVNVNGGVLDVAGSIGAGTDLAVNTGGTLAGAGAVNRSAVLNDGGTLTPGGAVPGSMLSGTTLLWHGGGTAAFDLGTGNTLALSGALTRGDEGMFHVNIDPGTAPAPGVPYTLATFASTDFATGDFSVSGLVGFLGGILVLPTSMELIAVTDGPSAVFDLWGYLNALADGQRGFEDNPAGDGIQNGLKFLLGLDPNAATAQEISATTVNVGGTNYPAITFRRREDLGGVVGDVLVSASLDFATDLGSAEVSADSQGDGTELVVVRSLVSLSTQPNQFFRVTATLPTE